MKKIYMLLIAVIVIGVLFLGAKQVGFLSVTDSVSSNPPSEVIGIPDYGTLVCENARSGNEVFTYNVGTETIRCNSALSLNDGCVITLKMPDDALKGTYAATYKYVICTDGRTCDTSNSDKFLQLRSGYINFPAAGKTITKTLTENQYILATYVVFNSPIAKGDYDRKDVLLDLTIKPYYIYRHDSYSQFDLKPLDNSRDCTVNGKIDEANLLIEKITGDGRLTNSLEVSEYLNMNNLRSKGASVSYLSHIVSAIVPQYDYYDGGLKYCQDKRLYDVETIETTGKTYNIVSPYSNKYVDVPCCNNGDAGVGNACVNFKIVPASEVATCNVFEPCKYAGGVYTAGDQYMYQDCVDNKCVENFVAVECSNSEDCDGGHCVINQQDPSQNKCEENTIVDNCGNNYCEATFGENVNTCPKDCDPNYPKNDNLVIWIIAGAAFIVILFVLLSKNKSNGGPINLG